jgi:hypothetical protein
MGTLNQLGYETSSYSTKREALVDVFKDAFGSTIRTDEESAQGQLIDYVTSLVDNEDKIGLSFFNQLNYRQATGSLLSAIAISKGQPRRSGTKAVITCDFTSSSVPYDIIINSLFKDTNTNFEFENTTLISISSLTQSAQLIAKNNGITNLIATNTLEAQGYYPNLTNLAITSIQDGTDDETDQELINRLSASDSETSVNDVDAIFDKLSNLTDTTRVVVLDNDSNLTINGIPPHNIEAVVLGGLDIDIAQTIQDLKASGTPTFGSTSAVATDSQGFPRVINFSRPNKIDIYVKIRILQRQGQPITANLDELSQLTLQYVNSLKISTDVSRTPIFGIWGNGDFDIDEIFLSTDGVNFVTTNIAIGIRDYAFMDNTNQVIVENV